MVRKFERTKLLIPLLLTLQSMSAVALTDSNPTIIDKHLISNAVRVQVTPRGMKYFDNRLSEILGNLGVNLDEGYFPAMSYTFDKAINPDDFMNSNPEAVKMYSQVRDLLTQWLVGFSMNNHQPIIEIGESGYIAQFSRFGLVTDEALMMALGKADGAVLAIELEVKKLTIATQSVVAWDTQNEFLGKAGFEDVTLAAGDEETPLKIRLPFYVRMNSHGVLEFEALEIDNNFDRIPMGLQYKKLIVPTFAVEINGKKFLLNNQEVEKLFNAQAPMILEKVRSSIGDFARKQLPEMLNQKAREFLTGSLEQIQDMAAPGQEPTDQRPPFKWGLQLQAINLKKSLNIDMTTYVEDPINSRSRPQTPHASRGAPAFAAVAQENYDIALSVDRALINRVLQLAFERRNFEQIKQTDGSSLKLVATPLIDYVKTPAGVALKPTETFLKMRVSVEIKPGSMFLKETIVVDFDIIAKLRQLSDKSGMEMLLHSINTDSLYLDDKYISLAGRMFKGKVREGVKDELKKRSAGWSKAEEKLPGGLPLPPQILGIKLDINRVVMDPNGHLVMYLDYAKTGVK